MQVTADHWLEGARRCESPYHNARPLSDGRVRPADEISLVVLHNISLPPGEYGGPWIDRLFTGTLPPDAHPYFAGIHAMEVSAHLLIRRDGELVQYVPFDRRAWHAGRSRFAGRDNCNDFSIGIELEGCDHEAFTDAQYDALDRVLPILWQTYPGSARRLTGHSDIAPGRKTDPGPRFDWSRLSAPHLGADGRAGQEQDIPAGRETP